MTTISEQSKTIESIIDKLHIEAVEITQALKDLPEILKDRVKLVTDTSDNVFILAEHYKNVDKIGLYENLLNVLFLTKEYAKALENASPEFKKLLSTDEVKYSVIYELIDYKEYNLITDEIKVKQAFIDLLSGDLL